MFFDNITLILNVLEQFAIHVTIFDLDVNDVFKHVNKLYFNNNYDFSQNIIKKTSGNPSEIINPHIIVKEALNGLDVKLTNDDRFYKVDYHRDTQFRFIY